MKKFLILSILACLFWGSAVFGDILGLQRYLQYDSFSQNKCKHYNAKVSCGVRDDLARVYAEVENSDAFLLTIQERSNKNKPFQIREYIVSFHYKDGITVIHKADYYDQFEEVIRATELPMNLRYWLVNIMKSLYPEYKFTPLTE